MPENTKGNSDTNAKSGIRKGGSLIHGDGARAPKKPPIRPPKK